MQYASCTRTKNMYIETVGGREIQRKRENRTNDNYSFAETCCCAVRFFSFSLSAALSIPLSFLPIWIARQDQAMCIRARSSTHSLRSGFILIVWQHTHKQWMQQMMNIRIWRTRKYINIEVYIEATKKKKTDETTYTKF